MKIYHGTSADIARRSLVEGLVPRDDLGTEGNWSNTVQSRGDMVYLTAAYAPYFAGVASPGRDPWGIVEVTFDDEDLPRLFPDEDYLEQSTRSLDVNALGHDFAGLATAATMEARTEFFRDRLEWFPHLWERSLDGISNVAHPGKIDRDRISRVAIFDPMSNPLVASRALDPAICLLNYQILGAQYRALSKWFFEPVTAEEFDPLGIIAALAKVGDPKVAEELNAAVAIRDGLEIIVGE